MAATPTVPISNIAAAFAAQSDSVNIPKPRDAAGGQSAPSKFQAQLLTPPNSISPTLPPHKVRSPSFNASNTRHRTPDSDIDLQDAVEHAASQDHPQALSSAALSGLEAAGAISPNMLAKHHLPEILLANGPMAIRHVLGHLTQSVPGFSRIPPAKARRIVVSALESRGGGGVNGDVLFEKVGWGRWDARMRGQPPREGRMGQSVPGSTADSHLAISPPASYSGSYAVSSGGGLQIPSSKYNWRDGYSGASWADDSAISSRDEEMEDMNMAEHEADKMSLDGSSSCAQEDVPITDDPDDVTDEEDWARMGAQKLRQRSVSNNMPTGGRRPSRVNYNYLSISATSRMKPTPSLHSHQQSRRQAKAKVTSVTTTTTTASALGSTGFTDLSLGTQGVQDAQERDAIEALLRMGGM